MESTNEEEVEAEEGKEEIKTDRVSVLSNGWSEEGEAGGR